MKKIVSVLLSAVLLVGTLVCVVNAEGSLIFKDDFTEGFNRNNWVQGYSDGQPTCLFEWDSDNKCLIGYKSAVVLQSEFEETDKKNKWWDQFYASFDVQIRGYDGEDEEGEQTVAMWYRDLMYQSYNGRDGEEGPVYTFVIDVNNNTAVLNKNHTFKYEDENGIMQTGNISADIATAELPGEIEVGDNAAWFNMGIRVTSGKIECYYNEELVMSVEASDDDEKLGGWAVNSVDSTVGSQKSAILFINENNYLALDNFEVWTPDYDFAGVTYGDADGSGAVNVQDASLVLKHVAQWSNLEIDTAAADANGDGDVNMKDAVLILQYAAGWDVVLGPQS